jgi:hypothetical protein
MGVSVSTTASRLQLTVGYNERPLETYPPPSYHRKTRIGQRNRLLIVLEPCTSKQEREQARERVQEQGAKPEFFQQVRVGSLLLAAGFYNHAS